MNYNIHPDLHIHTRPWNPIFWKPLSHTSNDYFCYIFRPQDPSHASKSVNQRMIRSGHCATIWCMLWSCILAIYVLSCVAQDKWYGSSTGVPHHIIWSMRKNFKFVPTFEGKIKKPHPVCSYISYIYTSYVGMDLSSIFPIFHAFN